MKKKVIAALLVAAAALSANMTAFAVSVACTTDTWKASNDLACLGSYTIEFSQAFAGENADQTRQVVYMDPNDHLDVWVSDYSYPASGTVYTLELVAVPLSQKISFIDSWESGGYGHYTGEIEMPLAGAEIPYNLLSESDFNLPYEEAQAKLETLAAPLLDHLNGSYPVYQIASDRIVKGNLGRPEDYLYFLGMTNSDSDGYAMISDVLFRFSDTGAVQTPAAPKTGVWASDNKGWWIQYPDGTYMVNDWYQSPASGLWYYMGADGYMLTNAITPDGFYVNADGVWVQ